MKGLYRPVCGVYITSVLWAGMACCYGNPSDQNPVTDCATGKLTLDELRQKTEFLSADTIRSRAGYEEAISRIESRGGAYAYDLVPELVGLGKLEREEGEFPESEKTFLRAFFIVRIHKGLYSRDQIPLLEMLIDNDSATGKWKTVADEYDLLYWLSRRNYGEDDPRQLPILKRLRQWHINAYKKDTGRSLGQHFRAARELYKKALEILTACGEDEKVALCFLDEACCSGEGQQKNTCPADKS